MADVPEWLALIGLVAILSDGPSRAVERSPSLTAKDLKNLHCMISVVRASPNTENAKFGATKNSPFRSTAPDDVVKPYIKWHYTGPDGPADIEFYALSPRKDGSWSYGTIFPNGLVPEPTPPNFKPQEWGADKIVDSWKKQCGVEAGIMSV